MKRVHVDRGGTFTDVVAIDDDGRVHVRKVPSDRAIVGDLADGAPLTFGTTVATNALLERKGVRTTLFTHRGQEDLVRIGDMTRPSLFDSDAAWPEPLCSAVVGVDGRFDADGEEIEPFAMDEPELDGVEGVAVALAHSPTAPEHEQRVAAVVERRSRAPYVSRGYEVSPEVGLLARIETALVDAAITPVLRQSLERDRIPEEALAVRSDGSLCPARALIAPDAVLSGPAGGVVAVARIARQAGFERAVGLDMGGTSTDVCRVDAARLPRREGTTRVAGVRLRRPTLEVETIAAGGGSILVHDGLRLRVGPESAGADPGPQCYGRGGPPTLTDAALAAGLVDPSSFDPPLDPRAVRLPADAGEFLDIARERMAAAVRRIALARGIDVSDHALVSYGGAAGQHAAEVAALLGIRTVLVHPCASVLSAWGQALARREETATCALRIALPEGWSEVAHRLGALEAELPSLGGVERTVGVRYAGTDHPMEIVLPDPLPAEGDWLARSFAQFHAGRYGFARPELGVEAVVARVRAVAPAPEPPAVGDDPWGLGDVVVRGPDLIVEPTTSVWIPPGWTAQRREGLLTLEPSEPARPRRPQRRTPYGVALWGSRFMAVAEQAGTTLQRLARSVNIRERLDFSCALFDGEGRLVANAPHIPVHLGAMGETVRDLLAHEPEPERGQAWLTNDPAAGGSHLPDLTVVSCVAHEGRRFFVASRAHHVDVGGVTPGSMPPRSLSLGEEGFVARRVPLLDGGALRPLDELLAQSREPETVRADLDAQIAANAQAARLLCALGPPGLLSAWMGHLFDVAREHVLRAVGELEEGHADDTIDGVPLRLRIGPACDGLIVDFAGTAGPHAGNLNAPRAVVRAAVLYAVRTLVREPIPLNDGAFEALDIRVPPGSILDPPAGAAVAGGNVETSQRIVDLFLRAAGARAASQGTMNNLTLGGRGWSYYETLGGGLGASPKGAGASARQVHMTNTRATDVEVLEQRLPLRVRGVRVRLSSGGGGRHAGGSGMVREIEVLEPARAALLSTRRVDGAAGLVGGGAGAPGRDQIRRDGRWEAWDGGSVDLAPGDRVRVSTPGGGGWGSAAGELPPRKAKKRSIDGD